MKKLSLEIQPEKIKYDVIIKNGIINEVGERIGQFSPSSLFIISNPTIMRIHGGALLRCLTLSGFKPQIITIPDGEAFKNLDEMKIVFERLLIMGGDRKSLIITFGGGVVGDMGGFAASVFMRGIKYIHVPTTVVSQTDSSIGGKVGVDLPSGKNIVGAFYHPQIVLSDPELLRTLPEIQFSSGMAEVIKTAIISGEKFFKYLENISGNLNEISSVELGGIIFETAKVKVEIVARDVFESGERMKLNLGHTIGHAIEALFGYKGITHGEAVAIGMVFACKISEKLGILKDANLLSRLKGLLEKFKLPAVYANLDPDRIMDYLSSDKKMMKGNLKFAAPICPGEVEILSDLDMNTIKTTLVEFCR